MKGAIDPDNDERMKTLELDEKEMKVLDLVLRNAIGDALKQGGHGMFDDLAPFAGTPLESLVLKFRALKKA